MEKKLGTSTSGDGLYLMFCLIEPALRAPSAPIMEELHKEPVLLALEFVVFVSCKVVSSWFLPILKLLCCLSSCILFYIFNSTIDNYSTYIHTTYNVYQIREAFQKLANWEVCIEGPPLIIYYYFHKLHVWLLNPPPSEIFSQRFVQEKKSPDPPPLAGDSSLPRQFFVGMLT